MPADKQRHHANDKSDFIPYPTDRVVGIINNVGDVRGALRNLKAAGFTVDDIRVLTGEASVHRIDVKVMNMEGWRMRFDQFRTCQVATKLNMQHGTNKNCV